MRSLPPLLASATPWILALVFLGHVKLAEILDAAGFDSDAMPHEQAVVNAWEECAKKDAEAEKLDKRFFDAWGRALPGKG